MEKFKEIFVTIPDELDGQRIDRALLCSAEIPSRSQASILIEKKWVKIKDSPVKASHKVRKGEVYSVLLPLTSTSILTPYNFPLDIVFEDTSLLVVNKPAGMVVHPSAGHSQNTLVNALLSHTKNLSMGFNENRPGIVHRIDRETSGLLVVAKNNLAHENLSAQFRSRTIFRKYHAIIMGSLKKEAGKIETLIGRDPHNRKRYTSAVSSGKTAITNYKVLATARGLSLLEVKLETGRTHQIRVHMMAHGTPIIGDNTYNADKFLKKIESAALRESLAQLNRIGLHAKELGFDHPVSNKKMFFTSKVPADLLPIYNQVGFDEFSN